MFLSAVLASLAGVVACSRPPAGGSADDRAAPLEALASPAAPNSEALNLSAGPGGRVYLTWLEPAGSGASRLRFSVRAPDRPWSAPSTIVEGADLFANWADTPSLLALANGQLVAQWSGRHVRGTEAAHILVARSDNQGRTWSAPVVAHTDRSRTQHGFVSLVETSDERVHAVWLDGRHTQGEGLGDMALMHAVLGDRGPERQEDVVDTRVCDCCPTAAAAVDNGFVVVYRDRSTREVRDISMARYTNGAWSEPIAVGHDGWEIGGCPVNGPSVSAAGSRVAVAWFTGVRRPTVSVAFSTDGGRSFAAPVALPSTDPVGRVDVAVLADGGALVSWIDETPAGAELLLQRLAADGSLAARWTVGAVAARSHPRLRVSGDEATVAWFSATAPVRLHTALLNMARKGSASSK